MSRDFLTNPTTEISIHRISILWAPNSSLKPTPLNWSLTHKALVFLLSTPTGLGGFLSTTFLSDSNDLSVFLLSFPTGLGGFSLIDLSDFLPQFSHWVRRFFTKTKWLCFYKQLIINRLILFLSFPMGLGGFLSINLAGFLPQFSHWVRRFFTRLSKWLHVWRGSRLRGKTIVMPWLRDPDSVSMVTWSRYQVIFCFQSNFQPNCLFRSSYKAIAYSTIL